MHSPSPPTPSPPPQAAPFPYMGIAAIVLVYAVISCLIIDYIGQDDEGNNQALQGINRNASGLSFEEAKALPGFAFDGNNTISSSCVICLDRFCWGERCRRFPGCRHVFHARCIDHWLARSLTCPTCRSPFLMASIPDIV